MTKQSIIRHKSLPNNIFISSNLLVSSIINENTLLIIRIYSKTKAQSQALILNNALREKNVYFILMK